MKIAAALFLIMAIPVACKPNNLTQPAPERPWEEFSQLCAYAPWTHHGAFLATLIESRVVEQESGGPSGAAAHAGWWGLFRLEDTIAGQPFDSDEGNWRIGETVWATGNSGQSCQRGAPTVGQRVVLFPWTSTYAGPEPGRSGRISSLGAHLFCEADGRFVLEDFTENRAMGMVEAATVSYEALKHAIQLTWGGRGEAFVQTLSRRLKEECAALSCEAPTTCFFGRECVDLRYLATVQRTLAPDGSRDAPAGTEASSDQP
jgi:hypothetical protein